MTHTHPAGSSPDQSNSRRRRRRRRLVHLHVNIILRACTSYYTVVRMFVSRALMSRSVFSPRRPSRASYSNTHLEYIYSSTGNTPVDKNMVSSTFFSPLLVFYTHTRIRRNDHFRLFPIMTMTSVFFEEEEEEEEKKDPLLRDRHTFCGATFAVYWHLEIISYTYDAQSSGGIRCTSSWGPNQRPHECVQLKKNNIYIYDDDDVCIIFVFTKCSSP